MKISVITVNYNNCDGLKRTISSVLGQTYDDFEYIIIDGGSADGSNDIIAEHQNSLAYWVSERDNGVYDAMNKGVSVAQGEYCLFLNSGDSFAADDILEKASDELITDYVCGNALLDGVCRWEAPDSIDELFIRNRYSICHQATFIRTSLLKARPYDTSFRIVSDFEHLAFDVMVNHISYRHINLVVCNYGRDGISSNDETSDLEKIKVLDSLYNKGILQEDEAVSLIKKMKPSGRRYKIALNILKILSR